MIRLGVIGFGGRISGVINHILRDVDPDLRVVGIVDPDEKGARARLADCDKDNAVFYKDLKTMVSKGKLDGLLIGTRCNLHAKFAIEAAKYDIPLYLEKPVAIDMKQATELEKAYETSKCPVVVSFPLRVSPLCTRTREIIEQGSIGNPVHICATNYVPYGTVYWEHEYRNFKITQGLFLQKATHDLDYMMYLMDEPIVRVSAMATKGKVFGGRKRKGLKCSTCKETTTCLESPENRKRNHSGGGNDHPCVYSVDCGTIKTGTNEDASSCLVEFASGAHGVYTQVFYIRRDAGQRGAIVSGYMGTVNFDWYRNDIKLVHHHKPYNDTIAPPSGLSHFGGDLELAYDYLGIIKGTCESRTPVTTGIQSVYACLAAKESAEKGKFVKVRQVGQVK